MADETTTETTPTEKPQAETPSPEKGVSPDEIVNAMRYMFKEMQSLKGNIEHLAGQNTQAPIQPQAPPPEAIPTEAVDVEMLDNKGLAKYVETRIHEQMRPWADSVQKLNDTSARSAVEGQVKKLRSDSTTHFDHFVNEVREIMEKKEGVISVEEALILAKASDPDKVQRLNEQQKKDSPKKESDPFVGLLPTSGKSSRNDRMEGKDAARAAWEELGLDDYIKEIPN